MIERVVEWTDAFRVFPTLALDLWDWMTNRVFEWGLVWGWPGVRFGWVLRKPRRQ